MKNENQIKNVKRNMLLLFAGRFISDFGTALFKFSLSLYVLDVTGSSTFYSLMLTLTILPGILISIFAGTLVDKYDKKKIIGLADLFSAISTAVLLFMIEEISDNLLLFGIGVVLVSFIQTFLNLGINSGVGNMVPADMVPKVNSYFQAMGAILTILGPIIGAICYGTLGIKMVLLIDCISYFLGAVFTFFMEFMKNKERADAELGLKNSVKYIFTYVKKYETVKCLMLMLFTLTFVYYPMTNVTLQNIMQLRVGASEIQLSYAVAALGVGVIIGALFTSMQKMEKALLEIPRKLFCLAVVVLLWCLPVFLYLRMETSNSRNLLITVVFCVILVMMGFYYTRIVIPSYSYMQMYVDENVRGRIFGLATSALNIAAPVGLVIYGLLLDRKIEALVIVASALLLAFLGLNLLSRIKNVNTLQEEN